MYDIGTKVMINKRLQGVIVDTKQVLRSHKIVTKYKIYISSNNLNYWLSDYYFIPMNEIKQNKFKLFCLNILSKFTFIKLHVDFKDLDNK